MNTGKPHTELWTDIAALGELCTLFTYILFNSRFLGNQLVDFQFVNTQLNCTMSAFYWSILFFLSCIRKCPPKAFTFVLLYSWTEIPLNFALAVTRVAPIFETVLNYFRTCIYAFVVVQYNRHMFNNVKHFWLGKNTQYYRL